MTHLFIIVILFLVVLSLIIYYNFEAFKTIKNVEEEISSSLEQRIKKEKGKNIFLQRKVIDIDVLEKTHHQKVQRIFLEISETEFSFLEIFKAL